jgi:hypothetical protein
VSYILAKPVLSRPPEERLRCEEMLIRRKERFEENKHLVL